MSKETILLVDDHKASGRSLELALNAIGFKVEAVRNPYDALEFTRRNSIQILIMDFDMRFIRGDDLAVKLNQIQTIPRSVIMSGQELNEKQLKFSFDFKISKPIEFQKLENMLRSCLKEKKTAFVKED